MVADHQGWKLNRDKEFLEMLIEGLNINVNRYGHYFCPCRDSWGTIEKDRDIVCPCDYCVPDQEEYGHCYCGLFLTKEFYESGKETQSIPERRDLNRFP
jgi:ferredoxin-thioredoxin reductase catalytic chain